MEWLLFFVAALGLLAFFEPCTIATHTLFAVRTHRAERLQCCENLFIIWVTRCALMVGLLVAAVLLTEPPTWGKYLPSLVLSLMAVVYLVSRFVYIPVPHLAFYRLLPGGQRLPFSIQLGLTLPACTLPLVVVLTGITISVNSLSFAMTAGILFATLFTLPMVFVAAKGLHEDGQQLLQRAAKGSPFLTAVLLFGMALYLLMPTFDMNVESLKQVLQHASWAGIGIGFVAGFVFSFNPVSFASIPVMLAYVTKAHEERRAVLMGAAFVLGMLVTHTVLGLGAALGGEWVQTILGREWGLLLGPVLILLGLIWPGWIKIRLPWIGIRGRKVTGLWGAFLLAIPFSVAVCPFCTPALVVALTSSAAIGSVGFGMALLFAFALGRSIPVLLGAWSMGWLESLRILSRYQTLFEYLAAVILILSGLYLLNEYFFIVQY